MVLISDGNSDIGAHVRSNSCFFICLKSLIKARAVTNHICSTKITIFLHACETCTELLSNISIMLQLIEKTDDLIARVSTDQGISNDILGIIR